MVPSASLSAVSIDSISLSAVDQIRREILAVLQTERCVHESEVDPCHGLFVRLSWHDAATWNEATQTGGPNGCMRFREGEGGHDINRGLDVAKAKLEPIKQRHDEISWADLWALAAVVALEDAGGPHVEFRVGRQDCEEPSDSAPEGRIPDGDDAYPHWTGLMGDMGFNTTDMVTLIGAHTLGGCHVEHSGFEGKWTRTHSMWDPAFYCDLLLFEWDEHVTSAGKKQFLRGRQMMLLTDMDLKTEHRSLVESYCNHFDAYNNEFARVFQHMQELGYPEGTLVLPE